MNMMKCIKSLGHTGLVGGMDEDFLKKAMSILMGMNG